MEMLIISGLSGAGKSRAASVLEDLNFYCVDNMPVELIPKFAEICSASGGRYERVAIATDIRNWEGFDELLSVLDELKRGGVDYGILFITASVECIVKRYKETRRPHPLERSGRSLEQCVREEMKILEPLRSMADYVIDTTDMPLKRLQQTIQRTFSSMPGSGVRLSVMSFGYKYGVPMEADFVLDVRFLPNPFYVDDMRARSGLDEDVCQYVFANGMARDFLNRFEAMLVPVLDAFAEEGKRSVTICVGCTGGHHRSVAVAEALAKDLSDDITAVECIHRDIHKE